MKLSLFLMLFPLLSFAEVEVKQLRENVIKDNVVKTFQVKISSLPQGSLDDCQEKLSALKEVSLDNAKLTCETSKIFKIPGLVTEVKTIAPSEYKTFSLSMSDAPYNILVSKIECTNDGIAFSLQPYLDYEASEAVKNWMSQPENYPSGSVDLDYLLSHPQLNLKATKKGSLAYKKQLKEVMKKYYSASGKDLAKDIIPKLYLSISAECQLTSDTSQNNVNINVRGGKAKKGGVIVQPATGDETTND